MYAPILAKDSIFLSRRSGYSLSTLHFLRWVSRWYSISLPALYWIYAIMLSVTIPGLLIFNRWFFWWNDFSLLLIFDGVQEGFAWTLIFHLRIVCSGVREGVAFYMIKGLSWFLTELLVISAVIFKLITRTSLPDTGYRTYNSLPVITASCRLRTLNFGL